MTFLRACLLTASFFLGIFCFGIDSFAAVATPVLGPQLSPGSLSLDASLLNTKKYLLKKRRDDGSWSGAYTLDASQDAFILAAGTKLSLMEPALRETILNTLQKRLAASGRGWSLDPSSAINLPLTSVVLTCLKLSGVEQNDPRFKAAWSWVNSHGGPQANLSLYMKLHLTVFGVKLDSPIESFTPKVFGLPTWLPMHLSRVGLISDLMVPYVTWDHLKSQPNDFYLSENFDSKTRIGTSSVKMLGLFEAARQLLGGTTSFERESMPRALNHFVETWVSGTEADWAAAGVAWLAERRNPGGAWYGTTLSLIPMLALQEADRVGLGDHRNEIQQAWQRILSWRTKNSDGDEIQKYMNSDIWDTAMSLASLSSLQGTPFAVPDAELRATVNWLVGKQIAFTDAQTAWSFDSVDKTHPDVDDTAGVLHAFTLSPFHDDPLIKSKIQEAFRWISQRQNSNGGFPAWDKNVSEFSFDLLRIWFPDTPRVEDLSQSDISSRAISALAEADTLNLVDHVQFEGLKSQACKYISFSGEPVRGIPFRTTEGHWMTDYIYSAATSLSAVLSADCPDFAFQKNWVMGRVNWLMQNQNPDGGWGESNESYRKKEFIRAPSTITQSNIALIALLDFIHKQEATDQTLDSSVLTSLQRGIDFLIKKSVTGTDYDEKEFTAVCVKAEAYNRYELMPAYSSLYVFSLWYQLQKRLMKNYDTGSLGSSSLVNSKMGQLRWSSIR